MSDESRKICFYCGALVSGSGRGDHFPLPASAGGTEVVPCCESCHDMKDRFGLDQWPSEWIDKIVADFPALSRETKIFLARVLRLFADHITASEGEGQDDPRPGPGPRKDS